jgi:hypothetical protein
VYVEQRLGTCEVCCRTIALQYHWSAEHVASASRDRMLVRLFRCPCCHHVTPFSTLMDAYGFELKAVPGLDPDGRVHAGTPRPRYLSIPPSNTTGSVASPPRPLLVRWLRRLAYSAFSR